MMKLAVVEWILALVVLAMAFRKLNAMTRTTCHAIRTAYVILAVSALAIVAGAAYDSATAALARAAAHVGILAAVVLLSLRGRRPTDPARSC